MAIHVTRLGSPRVPGEGLRLGTARRLPRGIRKSDYARRDYFDLWFPELAPSAKLLKWALSEPWTDARWERYAKRYRREMQQPSAQRILQVLARLSAQADFSIGCYCEREDRCHRSILRDLLIAQGASMQPARRSGKRAKPRAPSRTGGTRAPSAASPGSLPSGR
jgi:uncharacterized protein YeaO (DUF488 family)